MAEKELPLNIKDIDFAKISGEDISEYVDNKKTIDILDEIF